MQNKPNLIIGFGICFSIFIIIETITQLFYFLSWDIERFIILGTITTIILSAVFRVFALLRLGQHRAQLETSNRFNALQSKIAPHFLFNCLNTIAELGHIDPNHAEKAIQSLSKLLRTSLDDDPIHSVGDEINLCEKYLELEKWRLGDRLIIKWEIDPKALENTSIPKLLLQPLIENAVVHGIASAPSGGKLDVKLLRKNNQLKFIVSNSLNENSVSAAATKNPSGLGLASNNIKERLFTIYDDQQRFSTKSDPMKFTASIEIPINPNKNWLNLVEVS